jgi:hypothetical protein
MNGRTKLTILVAVAVLAACSSTHYVRIRHPLHVGQVDPNSVPFQAAREERPRGLPQGTLVDAASLTEVTPERICMQINLWSIPEVDPGRGDYQSYRIALLNDQQGVERADGQIQLAQPMSQAYNGHIAQQIHAGYQTVCAEYRNRGCVRYRQEPIYRTIFVPHVWQVNNHPATMCFPNGGFVTPATTRLALEVDGAGPGSMVFEWQFDSAVAGQPAPVQQQQQ